MNARRRAFGVGVAFFAALAIANVAVWHATAWLPIVLYGATLCALAMFERGRYRPPVVGLASAWQATGERFFDPVSGAPTKVFYDPQTGAREYRSEETGSRGAVRAPNRAGDLAKLCRPDGDARCSP